MAITDLLKGTQLKGLFSGSSTFFNIAGQILIILVLAAFVVGIVWLISHRKRYNLLNLIFSRRSGTLKFFTDMAAYTKDKKTNMWDYRLRSLKETLSPPPYKILLTGLKGNNVAVYYQNSAGELYPCEVEIIEPTGYADVEYLVDGKVVRGREKIANLKLKIIEPDIALWSTQMDQKLLDTYGNKTWWDKYGNQVLFFGTATLVLVLIYLVLKKIDVVAEAARLFKESAEYLKQSGIQAPSTAP